MKNNEVEYLGDADEQKCIAAILAQYPWETYNYKAHAWVRKPRKWASWRTGEHYKWAVSTDTPIQIISRTTGESISELPRYHPTRRYGIMLFAGDPKVIGVVRTVTPPTGPNAVWFTHSTAIDRDTALQIGLALSPHIGIPNAVPEPQFSNLIWLADLRPEAISVSVALERDKRKLRKIPPAQRNTIGHRWWTTT